IEVRKTGKEREEIISFDPEISVSVDAYLPSSYIEDEIQKIEMYKRFQTLESKEDEIDLQDELIDRFGEYPEEVGNLLTVSILRKYAKEERVESITEFPNKIELLLEDDRSKQVDGSKLFDLANEFGRTIQLGTEQNKLKIMMKWTKDTKHNRYQKLEDFIKKLSTVNRDE